VPSSIRAARLNLYTALAALTATGQDLEGWQVTIGPPEVHSEERKVVALLMPSSILTEHAEVGGSGGQEESYSIPLRAKVHDTSCNGDPAELQAIDAELWDAYEVVRQTVKADQTLGGVITISAIVATAEPGRGNEESPTPAVTKEGTGWGWVAFVDWRVDCRTRIT
jgi:hypothetical protein